MRLPKMKYADGIRKRTIDVFGGLNCNIGAGDGEIWRMVNMTSNHYPVLACREPRWKYLQLKTGGRGANIYAYGDLCWIDDDGFHYEGAATGLHIEDPEHCMIAGVGNKLVFMPEKKFYNTETGDFGSMEESSSSIGFFSNGTYNGEDAEANCLKGQFTPAGCFSVGDAVTISGCVKHPENNKTLIIREIVRALDGEEFYFYENSFELGGEETVSEDNVVLSRTVPTLNSMFECGNRIWGCDDQTIYASKLGDIFNWNVFDGTEDDSWQWSPITPGDFTGGIAYNGFPIFFKENEIHKIYGDYPSEFQAVKTVALGVGEGNGRSLAIVDGTLFYLSNYGVAAYTGGMPALIGQELGEKRMTYGIAGSDGVKYYLTAWKEFEDTCLYVYDTRKGMWHMEDVGEYMGFACLDRRMYLLDSNGQVWITGDSPFCVDMELARENAADDGGTGYTKWEVEFCDFTDDSPNEKGISKLQLRYQLQDGFSADVFLMYNSDETWVPVKHMEGDGQKQSAYIPMLPRRADHYRMKITGEGSFQLYSMTIERYKGSEHRSK